jgi:hypothetical protein
MTISVVDPPGIIGRCQCALRNVPQEVAPLSAVTDLGNSIDGLLRRPRRGSPARVASRYHRRADCKTCRVPQAWVDEAVGVGLEAWAPGRSPCAEVELVAQAFDCAPACRKVAAEPPPLRSAPARRAALAIFRTHCSVMEFVTTDPMKRFGSNPFFRWVATSRHTGDSRLTRTDNRPSGPAGAHIQLAFKPLVCCRKGLRVRDRSLGISRNCEEVT